MADQWTDVSPASSPNEWQDVQSPKSGMNFGDMAFDTLARVGMGSYDATKWIPGVSQLANMMPSAKGEPFQSADDLSQNLKNNANLGQQVIQGTGQAIATIPQMLPFVKAAQAAPIVGTALGGSLAPIAGMAGLGATQAGMQGQSPIQGAVQGAGQGLAYSAGGALGSKLGQMAFNPIARAIGGSIGQGIAKSIPTIGTSLGMAGTGAITNPQSPVSSGIIGGALGATSPMGQNNYQDVLNDAASGHRQILNPSKGDINNLEIKSGKDIDDSMRLAAQQGLIYGKTSDGSKLDTSTARQQNLASIAPYEQQLNQVLASDPHKLFDLQNIATKTKAQLNDPNSPNYLKNGEDYQNAVKSIDNATDAEINRPGGNRFVNAQQLNTIKQGLWGRSYTPDAPNANNIARQLGYNAKDAIEQAFPNQDVASLNQSIGDRMTLNRLLENAQGRTIQSGKIGKYVSGMVGAMTGQAVGKVLPGIGEVVGPVAGYEAGSKLNGILNDPTRVSTAIASKVKQSQFINGVNIAPKFNPVQQVPPPQAQQTNLGQFNPIQPTNPQGTILGANGQSLNQNPLANPVSPQGLPPGVKALGVAGAGGLASMFNPLNSQASQPKDQQRLQLPADQYTKQEEGFQPHPYMDINGNKTIGYGFKMDAVGKYLPRLVQEGKRPLTKQEGDDVFNKLYGNARNAAQDFAGDNWHSMNGQQQKSLSDMAYNMGGKLNGFKKLQQAIEEGNYPNASNEIMNSNYAKEAPNRAKRNSILMQS